MKQALRFLLLAAFAIASLTAQRTGAPPAGGSPGGGSAPGNAPSPLSIPSTSPSSPGSMNPESSIPIFLSGKVMVDDGSPAPQNIGIQRICAGDPRTVAWTDGKGRFNFQWGNTNGSVIPDASESSRGMGRMTSGGKALGTDAGSGTGMAGMDPLQGCELRASIAGFRSDTVNLSGHRALDNSDVGTIVLHRLANVEGTSVSATALNAPKDAQKAYEKGLQSLHKAKPDDAAKDFQKAVQLYPKYANAWLDLGRAQLQRQMTDAARESFHKAVEADAKLVDAWVELGLMAARAANWADTAQYLDRALRLDPVDYPQILFPDAVAEYNLKNFDGAEKSAREAVKADPGHQNPKADQLLGNVLLRKGEYAEAGEELRVYMKFAPNAPDLDQVKAQLAQIDLAAKQPKQP